MRKLSRRECLQGSLAGGAGAAAACALPTAAWSRALGANDDIRLAFIGLQHRGPQLLEAFRRLPGVRVVGLCDADRSFLDAEAAKFEKRGEKVRAVQDFRRLLDDRGVDAVVLATPNHWHALMTVWACQAGKDVYVEKPVSHNIWEGRKMVQAARKHNRVVQAGTQNRSDVGLQEAIAFLRAGHLGKMLLARGFDWPRRPSMGKVDGPQPVPATVDYDLFLGPAPLVPLMRKNLHYDWHFAWPTGNGDCGNRGVHTLDHIRWAIDQAGLPPRVRSIAGRFGPDDDGQTPNTQVTLLDYQPVPILFELRGLAKGESARPPAGIRGIRHSMVIECEGGCFAGGRGGGWVHDQTGKRVRHFQGDGGLTHPANFIAAMRSRKPADLRADILEGHVSSALCHVANISYLVGRRSSPQQVREAVKDHAVLAQAAERMLDHLGANGVDLAKTPVTLGPMLTMDTAKEQFVGEAGDWANMYLGRIYRPPFVVPQEV